jgi:ribosomal protein S18 acetylase RimI-like enzyme
MLVRQLTNADAASFRALRLAGLRDHPDAFGSSWEEEAAQPLSWFADTLRDGYVIGCETDSALVGIAGFFRGERLKTRHRGTLWGMYVAPEARGQGVGSALVQHIIGHAQNTVEELNLTVAAHNQSAMKLYESMGFVRNGLDPRALKIAGEYVDEVSMRLVI